MSSNVDDRCGFCWLSLLSTRPLLLPMLMLVWVLFVSISMTETGTVFWLLMLILDDGASKLALDVILLTDVGVCTAWGFAVDLGFVAVDFYVKPYGQFGTVVSCTCL